MIKEIQISLNDKEQKELNSILNFKENPNHYHIIDKYNSRLVIKHKDEVFEKIIKFIKGKFYYD